MRDQRLATTVKRWMVRRCGQRKRCRRRAGGRLSSSSVAFAKSSPTRADVAAWRRPSRAPLSSSPPSVRTFSWMAIVSAPSGTGAPVKMRTASPGPTAPANSLSGRRHAGHRQPRRHLRHVRGAHRIAVHGRSREGRLRPQRLQAAPASTRPGRLRQRHGLRCQRLGVRPAGAPAPRRPAAAPWLCRRPVVAGFAAGLFDQPYS